MASVTGRRGVCKQPSLKGEGGYVHSTGNRDKPLREFKREARSFPVQAVRDFPEEMIFKPHLERGETIWMCLRQMCLHSLSIRVHQNFLGQAPCQALKTTVVENMNGLGLYLPEFRVY